MDKDNARPVSRREVLYPVTAGCGLVALGWAGWGLLQAAGPQPDYGVLSVDLSDIPEGSEVTVRFEGRPILIRHRTAAEIAAAEAEDDSVFPDPLARNANLAQDAPATDRNRRATPDGRFLVISQACPHMGCLVMSTDMQDVDAWFCPCCSARFDRAGRTRGIIARTNLPVPRLQIRDGNILDLLPPGRVPPEGMDRLLSGS